VVRRVAAKRSVGGASVRPPPQRISARDDRDKPLVLPAIVRFAGLRFDYATASIDRLWSAYAGQDWTTFLPGLAAEGQQYELLARLADLDDPLDIDDVARAARRIGSALAGIDWWGACRIAGVCEANRFLFLAWAALQGINTEVMSLPHMFATGYAYMVDACEDVAALDLQLWTPPPTAGIPRWESADEARDFATALATMGRARPA